MNVSPSKHPDNKSWILIQGPSGPECEAHARLLDHARPILWWDGSSLPEIDTSQTPPFLLSKKQLLLKGQRACQISKVELLPLDYRSAWRYASETLQEKGARLKDEVLNKVLLLSLGERQLIHEYAGDHLAGLLDPQYLPDPSKKIDRKMAGLLWIFLLTQEGPKYQQLALEARPLFDQAYEDFHLKLEGGAYELGAFKSYLPALLSFYDEKELRRYAYEILLSFEVEALPLSWNLMLLVLKTETIQWSHYLSTLNNSCYDALWCWALPQLSQQFKELQAPDILNLLTKYQRQGQKPLLSLVQELAGAETLKGDDFILSLVWQEQSKHLQGKNAKCELQYPLVELVQEALALRKKGDLTQAIVLIQKAKELSQNEALLAELCQIQTVNLIQHSSFAQAVHEAQEAARLFQKQGNMSAQNVALFNQMIALENAADIASAHKILANLKTKDLAKSLALSLQLFEFYWALKKGNYGEILQSPDMASELTLSQNIFLKNYQVQALLHSEQKLGTEAELKALSLLVEDYPALKIKMFQAEVIAPFADVLLNLGNPLPPQSPVSLKKAEELSETMAIFSPAKKYLPDYWEVKFRLAFILGENEKMQEALDELGQFTQAQGEESYRWHVDLTLYQAFKLWHEGDFKKAWDLAHQAQTYACAMELKPREKEALWMMLHCAQRLQDWRKLLQISELLQKMPGKKSQETARFWRALGLLNSERFIEAQEAARFYAPDLFPLAQHVLELIKNGPRPWIKGAFFENHQEILASWFKENIASHKKLIVLTQEGASAKSLGEIDWQMSERPQLYLNLEIKKVYFMGEEVQDLFDSAISLKLLTFFLENAPKKHSKEDLIRYIWNENYDPKRHHSLVYMAVSRLCEFFGTTAQKVILNQDEQYFLNPQYNFYLLGSTHQLIKELNLRQLWALNYLKYNSSLTNQVYAKEHGVSSRTALRDLMALVKKGYLSTSGKGKGLIYKK